MANNFFEYRLVSFLRMRLYIEFFFTQTAVEFVFYQKCLLKYRVWVLNIVAMVWKFETPQMNFLHTLNFQLSKRGQCRHQMTQNQTVLLLFFKGNWSQNNGSLSLAETSGFCYENCKNLSSTDISKNIFFTKGQIISKGLFGILGFFQKMNEQIHF